MTPAREPPSYVGCAIGFASAGFLFGAVPGVVMQLATTNSVIGAWSAPGAAGGIVAGFALGLTYAFVRRFAVNREPEE